MANFRNIEACVFDAYGTLFDVHSAVERFRARLGDAADRVSLTWRAKQLEYTWLRSLMGRWDDFARVTTDALDYALESVQMDDGDLRTGLLDAYRSLECFDDVRPALEALAEGGVRTAILSNGSREMLDAAVRSSGIGGLLEAVLSVDDVRVFKPDPRVYQLAVDRLGIDAARICFLSSNSWDAAGAAAFGMRVVWVNRFAQAAERLPASPDVEIVSLTALPSMVLPLES